MKFLPVNTIETWREKRNHFFIAVAQLCVNLKLALSWHLYVGAERSLKQLPSPTVGNHWPLRTRKEKPKYQGKSSCFNVQKEIYSSSSLSITGQRSKKGHNLPILFQDKTKEIQEKHKTNLPYHVGMSYVLPFPFFSRKWINDH